MFGLLRKGLVVIGAVFLIGGEAMAAIPQRTLILTPDIESLVATIDTFWVLTAATLVLMMQIGFMLIEAGSVRTKNAISVAQKNMLDFCFSTIAFAVLGFGIAFGTASTWLPIGTDREMFFLSGLTGENAAFFIFQVMFCGTAATIISGAVAERMRLRAYIILSTILALLVYPVFVQWAWGNALSPSSGAFLADAGFVDFAGSTVVHGTGGWFALAACIILGPRKGRFSSGVPMRIGGHSSVLSSAGALFLFVGWIGFNGGSTLSASDAVPGIILNTLLAGAAGGALGYGISWFKGAMLPERAVNGMIGGLVAVTAGCHIVGPGAALLLGALGSLAANGANSLLESRFRVDDSVGAIGVHAFAGVVGTLGLALLAPLDALPAGSRFDQFLIQGTGTLVNFTWAFGIGFVLLTLLKPVMQLRVSPEEEAAGQNASEHGAKLGTDHIQAALEALVHSNASEGQRLAVEAGDDNEHLSITLNNLMDKLQHAEAERFKQIEMARSSEDEKRLTAFGEVASESILLIHNDAIRSANAAAAVQFASTSESLIGRPAAELVRADFHAQFLEWLRSGDDTIHNATVIDSFGKELPVELRFRQMQLNGHEVVVLRMTDLSEREEARNRIYHLAMHDPLTDLPNRELFNRSLSDALTRQRTGALTALLIVDLDRFKDVNDLHGHQSGDVLLMEVAERLLANVRGCDTVARLGGDEFAIIYSNITFANQALDLAIRILDSVGKPLTLPTGAIIHPRASVGLAISPHDATEPQAMVRNADLALYSVKNRGRNGFGRYHSDMGNALRRRQELEESLSCAMGRSEFELHYQPRFNVEAGEVTSFEALIRWRHDGQLILPQDFIGIAEESGLIIPIGAWVIGEACRAAVEDMANSPVSVNISVRQFQDPDLVAKVARALASSGLTPSSLELEITESVLIEDDTLASRTLRSLRELGVKIALDDFGTGYSSLSYLTRFHFDTIKIDKSFIQSEDERTWQIIRSVLQMSACLGTAVVAEGVETSAQLDRLRSEGCKEIQGFLISEPVRAGDALAIRKQTSWYEGTLLTTQAG